jgi:hypothetical protein
MPSNSQESLKLLTDAIWKATGNEGDCPPDKYSGVSTARQPHIYDCMGHRGTQDPAAKRNSIGCFDGTHSTF